MQMVGVSAAAPGITSAGRENGFSVRVQILHGTLKVGRVQAPCVRVA